MRGGVASEEAVAKLAAEGAGAVVGTAGLEAADEGQGALNARAAGEVVVLGEAA